MADLNNGKGKFWGVDENVKYADSFKGATKVAEKVKKGGTEKKSDGYVVDAIDIDWGGLKLTTIADQWQQGMQTVSSTEQNAGKGDNTKGIHSTAYLLNKISSSFTQIYNQIGKDDTAADSLRKKIKDLESSIKDITGSDPGQLADIRTRIQQIEKELSDPGATNTMISILDSLVGFDKTKGSVKKYIDDNDKAILGSTADAATTYSVYGVRKYVDTIAKNTLLGASGDAWPNKHTIYGVAKYAEEKASTSYNNAIGAANNYTNQAIGTAESTLIGSTADAATTDTIWGAKNYANTTVKNSLLGTSSDLWPNKHTIYGVAKYADTTVKGNLIGKEGDIWSNQKTLYGVVKYSDNKNADLKKNLIGTSTDTTIDTHYGLKHILIGNTADTTINTHWGVKNSLIGTASDTKDSNTIKGAKKYADKVQTNLVGASTDASTADTIWGAKKYADEAKAALLGTDDDLMWPEQKTIHSAISYLIGVYDDSQDTNSIYGAKNYADFQDGELEKKLIGTSTDTTINTHHGLKHILIGKSTDAPTADTIWGAKNYANTTVKKSLIGASGDQWPTKQTIWGVKNSLLGKSTDASTADTIWGAKNYAEEKAETSYINAVKEANAHSDTKFQTLSGKAFHVRRIVEGDEGILEFVTVSSYLG